MNTIKVFWDQDEHRFSFEEGITKNPPILEFELNPEWEMRFEFLCAVDFYCTLDVTEVVGFTLLSLAKGEKPGWFK